MLSHPTLPQQPPDLEGGGELSGTEILSGRLLSRAFQGLPGPLWSPDPLAAHLFFCLSPIYDLTSLPTDPTGYFPPLGTSLLTSVLEPQPNRQVFLLIPGNFHLGIRGCPEQKKVLSSWKPCSSFFLKESNERKEKANKKPASNGHIDEVKQKEKN